MKNGSCGLRPGSLSRTSPLEAAAVAAVAAVVDLVVVHCFRAQHADIPYAILSHLSLAQVGERL